jgi:D-lactate dehydrogenase (cytochrome)
MFRAARPLTRFLTSAVKRGATRNQSAATQLSGKPIVGQKPFWTAGRVLLFTAFTGSFTYLYGVNNVGKRFQLPWLNSATLNYANKRDMEKVMRRKNGFMDF